MMVTDLLNTGDTQVVGFSQAFSDPRFILFIAALGGAFVLVVSGYIKFVERWQRRRSKRSVCRG